MKTYTKAAQSAVNPPQSKPLPGRETEMVKNAAGGYTFTLDKWGMLDRFLILGTEGGTYYAGEAEHTEKNFTNLAACVKEDGVRTVGRILDIDRENRAPKMATLIFALAYCLEHGDAQTKLAAQNAMPLVLRIGTHIFQFVSALRSFKNSSTMGRVRRRALTNLLNSFDGEKFAFNVAKYANREGWTWDDLLRVIHPNFKKRSHRAIAKYVTKGEKGSFLPEIFTHVEKAKLEKTTDKQLIKLIEKEGLTHEMIPSERQKGDVLRALGENMPATALLRQLGRLAAAGILTPMSSFSNQVAERLGNEEWLRKSRVHPIAILSALMVYSRGHGVRGNLTWEAAQNVRRALEEAFYASFKHVRPTGKNLMISMDVSGSMFSGEIAGIPGLDPATAAACLAMVTARSEKNFIINAYGRNMIPVDISGQDSLNDVMRKISDLPWEGTDCSKPITHATQKGYQIDGFINLTDNETWAGPVHVSTALNHYRRMFVKNARIVVVGMTATQNTVLDPNDPLGLNVVGFDSAAPAIMADFIRG